MKPPVATITTPHSPEALTASLAGIPGRILLRTGTFESPHARYSLVAAEPFLVLRSLGSRCEIVEPGGKAHSLFGNPWRILERLLARFELLEVLDVPFPLGGAFGYLGFDLCAFVEPRLRRRILHEPAIPDAWIGFYDSLVVMDHLTGQTSIVATGLRPDGTRDSAAARASMDLWRRRLETSCLRLPPAAHPVSTPRGNSSPLAAADRSPVAVSNFTRDEFIRAVRRAQDYIRAGDIYQVNLAQRFSAGPIADPWAHWCQLFDLSPSPFGLFLDAGDLHLASLSPELFLRLSGDQIITRPIKGTRPRSPDPTVDAQLAFELQTSPKEAAELVMITDLLRNDLGRVCDFGSVQVPDLLRLERYAHVQHLVSTVEGRLRPEITHLAALESCFPGGSITGAPKIRAVSIIDELEPHPRGPYTGCAGYLGFNRESQFNILIRTSVVHQGMATYHAGAGIVADSDPQAEYDETLAKARAFLSITSSPQPDPGCLRDHASLARSHA